MSYKTRAGLVMTLAAALMLAACMRGEPTDSKNESEQLLKTTNGPMRIVEQKGKPDDPMQANLNARGQVNPSPESDASRYTSTPSPEDLNEPMHFRVLKLEHQMAGLQEDFDKLLPPLKTLAATDDQLDQTLAQIKARQEKEAAEHKAQYEQTASAMPAGVTIAPPPPTMEAAEERAQAAANMPAPLSTTIAASPPPSPEKVVTVTTTTPPAAAAPAVASTGVSVMKVRVGEHPGNKVRIVLDLSGPAKFKADLDNNEKLLMVDLPGVAWSADAQKTLKSALLKGYTAQKSATGEGTTLAFELSAPAKVVMSMAMPPNESYGHRIVLDLAPL